MAKKASSAADTPERYEELAAQLEEVVQTMERGGLELEVALDCYETGLQLLHRCQQALEAAQRRMDMLVRKENDWQLEALENMPLRSGAGAEDEEEGE